MQKLKTKKIQITTNVEPEIYEQLQLLAETEQRSLSFLMSKFIREGIEKSGATRTTHATMDAKNAADNLTMDLFEQNDGSTQTEQPTPTQAQVFESFYAKHGFLPDSRKNPAEFAALKAEFLHFHPDKGKVFPQRLYDAKKRKSE